MLNRFIRSRRNQAGPKCFHFSLSNHHYPALKENTPEKIRETLLSLKEHPDVDGTAILVRVLDPSTLMVKTVTLDETGLETLISDKLRELGEEPSEHIDFPSEYIQ